MQTLTPAKSQKAEDRPISFILDAGDVTDEVVFFIRPDDMVRTLKSRMSVNQTIGGAWVDAFGEGIPFTTISGTLGWRTGPDGLDGGERLIDMRDRIFTQWHALRQEAVDRGDDPSTVKLRFVDTLNRYAAVVAPDVFEIRRNKSRPLLASYRIAFYAMDHNGVGFKNLVSLSGSDVDPSGFGLGSLGDSLSELNSAISDAKNFVNKTILAPVLGFMNLTSRVLTTVQGTIANGLSLADPLINVARGLTQAGTNVFRTMAAIEGIPAQVQAKMMQVASAYSNLFCVLKNGIKTLPTYEDYNALYGSSNCSSTGGGSPPSQYSAENPFFKIVPPSTGADSVGVSVNANRALEKMMRSDVVVAPMSLPEIGAALSDVNTGVLF